MQFTGEHTYDFDSECTVTVAFFTGDQQGSFAGSDV
jgi:hypothetical protein